MSDVVVKKMIEELFAEMNEQVAIIVKSSTSSDVATSRIMEYVSSTVTSNSLGYLSALYSSLSKKTLSEELFKNPDNVNKFYELGLRQRLVEAYEFDVESVSAYKEGIDFEEINQLYLSLFATTGTTLLSGILLAGLSRKVHIPFVIIIAGAILVGLGAGAMTYGKIVPAQNKKKYVAAVLTFMEDLENSLMVWVDDVVKFYNAQIEELKASL